MNKAADEAGQPLLDPPADNARSKLNGTSLASLILTVAVCAAWMVVSSLLIILNKHIMVDLGFEYSMTVAGMGMVVSSLGAFICCRVLKIVEVKQKIDMRFYAMKIMPIGFFMALTLVTGNQVYMYLTVAFIQMLKAFTPVITMIALFVARLEDPSARLVNAVLLISAGTAVAAYGEVNLSVIGMICMMASETAESIKLVLTQLLLVGMKFHPIEGLMYLAPACCFWLSLGMYVTELPLIMSRGALSIAKEHKWEFLAAASMGFAVNALSITVIKLAGSLTLKVLGTVKNTLLIVVASIFLGELVTGTQSLGYAVSLLGFVWYNQIKLAKMSAASKP